MKPPSLGFRVGLHLGGVFGNAVGAEELGAFVYLRVISQDRATLGGGDRLDRVEAQFGGRGQRAHLAAPVGRAQRVRRVGDHGETVFFCKRVYFVVVGGVACKVDGNDQFCPLCEGGLEPRRVQIARILLHVHKFDRRPQIERGVGGGGEGQGRGDHLVARA